MIEKLEPGACQMVSVSVGRQAAVVEGFTAPITDEFACFGCAREHQDSAPLYMASIDIEHALLIIRRQMDRAVPGDHSIELLRQIRSRISATIQH